MKKILLLSVITVLLLKGTNCLELIQENQELKNGLIRLHVTANSDALSDQEIKYKVKDSIVDYLNPLMENLPDKETAIAFLQKELKNIEKIAEDVLKIYGIDYDASVTLQKETFDKRVYDTFSLPAGVYDSLRIQLGSGTGKNWWCVAFPALCVPRTEYEFADAAVSAGFDRELVETISSTDDYEIRFFILDWLGKMENLLYEP